MQGWAGLWGCLKPGIPWLAEVDASLGWGRSSVPAASQLKCSGSSSGNGTCTQAATS